MYFFRQLTITVNNPIQDRYSNVYQWRKSKFYLSRFTFRIIHRGSVECLALFRNATCNRDFFLFVVAVLSRFARFTVICGECASSICVESLDETQEHESSNVVRSMAERWRAIERRNRTSALRSIGENTSRLSLTRLKLAYSCTFR